MAMLKQSYHPVFSVTKRRPSLPFLCILSLVVLRSLTAFQSQATTACYTCRKASWPVGTRRRRRAFSSKNPMTGILCSDENISTNTTSNIDIDETSIISETSKFGESVPFVPLSQRGDSELVFSEGSDEVQVAETLKPSVPLSQRGDSELLLSEGSDKVQVAETLEKNRIRNIVVAVASFSFAVASYFWQFTHPVTAIEILATMERSSAPLTAIGNNGKPTVIDFWAPWCENCRVAAPTLQAVEEEYGERVNFIMVNGDDGENWPLIQLFGVDSIPHLALLSKEGDVETALIGPMSRNVLRADIDALLNSPQHCKGEVVCHDDLPYKMFDAFGNKQDSRRINFVKR